MVGKASAERSKTSSNNGFHDGTSPVEATIHALEQRAIELDEAHYEALREARDASRRAAELRLQAIEMRMRLCALMECEPIRAHQHTSPPARPAVLRLAKLYFDDPGKYRLVLCSQGDVDGKGTTADQVDEPAWCSKVVYDAMRPEGKGAVAIADAVRGAYRIAESRGYRLIWATAEMPAEHQLGYITPPCHEQEA
jgi:hypothetical protein